jgi:hypothetical protein
MGIEKKIKHYKTHFKNTKHSKRKEKKKIGMRK